jgi:hypothetical protein
VVGLAVGTVVPVGAVVGTCVGLAVGTCVGLAVGTEVGVAHGVEVAPGVLVASSSPVLPGVGVTKLSGTTIVQLDLGVGDGFWQPPALRLIVVVQPWTPDGSSQAKMTTCAVWLV